MCVEKWDLGWHLAEGGYEAGVQVMPENIEQLEGYATLATLARCLL